MKAKTGNALRVPWPSLYCRALTLLSLAGVVFAQPVPNAPGRAAGQISQLPLGFEPNSGQFDPRIRFLCRTTGFELSLTRDAALISLAGASATLRLAGAASAVEPAGVDRLP